MDLVEYLTDLRASIDRRADRLDMQALADAYVADMDDAEVSDVFGGLTDDWETALAHAGHPEVQGRTACPVEGELLPCRVLRGLAVKYEVRPREHGTGLDGPPATDSPGGLKRE